MNNKKQKMQCDSVVECKATASLAKEVEADKDKKDKSLKELLEHGKTKDKQ